MIRDVLIVGGGIAGSSLAILLGRNRVKVQLFEREHFPREKACGEGIMPAGVAALQRLGLVEAVGGAPFYGVRYHFAGDTAEGRFPVSAGIPSIGRGQRRLHLDKVLFDAATATAGVTTHTDAPVQSLHCENGRVRGVWVNGELHCAALVVAADGVHSRIRQQLGLNGRPVRKRFGVRAHFRLASNREQPPWVDVFAGRGHELCVTPLPEGEITIAALAHARPLREPMERAFQRWCDSHPELACRLENAQRASGLLSSAPLACQALAGVASGVALLGDAAGSSDPITGGGIMQALQTAELLAAHVFRNLGKDDRWLLEFDRERRALLRDCALVTRTVLWLSDHPRLARYVLLELKKSPRLFSHLIGVSAGLRKLWRHENSLVRESLLVSPDQSMKQITKVGEIPPGLSL